MITLDEIKEKMIFDFEEEREGELGRAYELGLCHAVDYLASQNLLSVLPKLQKVDLDGMKQDDLPPFTPVEYMLKAEGWDDAIDGIKAKYGELYAIERE